MLAPIDGINLRGLVPDRLDVIENLFDRPACWNADEFSGHYAGRLVGGVVQNALEGRFAFSSSRSKSPALCLPGQAAVYLGAAIGTDPA